jgi:hypothetical protein
MCTNTLSEDSINEYDMALVLNNSTAITPEDAVLISSEPFTLGLVPPAAVVAP